MLRSKKLTEWSECSCVNVRFGWKLLRPRRKEFRWSKVSVQMIKMSSMYRARRSGLMFWEARKFLRIVDRNMFAMVGEKAAPIAVPFICWKKELAKLK